MRRFETFLAALALTFGGALAAPLVAQAPVPAPVVAQQAAPAGGDTAVAATPTPVPAIARTAPTPGIGMPDGSMGLQPQVTDIGREAAWMHDWLLMPVMTAISLLVLGLLLYVVWRFRASANPVPSKTSHNTVIEVVWTLLPVLVLLVIAVPSIRLLARQYAPPKADLTVKVIGNQWYWTYQYPDNGDFEIVSNMLPEGKRTDVDGPKLLAVDERMVVPVNAVVKVIVTSNDVIHSFAVPAFWTKMDAVPGRLNETWFKVDRPGVYFGQCSELCGARHGFMPIAVQVVSKAEFAQWVASKGGTMPGRQAPPPTRTPPARPRPPWPGAGAGSSALPTVGTPSPAISASAPVTGTSQGATRQRGLPPMTDTTASPAHFQAHDDHAHHHDADHKPGFFARWFHVDQPQGHRHALPDLRDHRGDHRRRHLGPDARRTGCIRASNICRPGPTSWAARPISTPRSTCGTCSSPRTASSWCSSW